MKGEHSRGLNRGGSIVLVLQRREKGGAKRGGESSDVPIKRGRGGYKFK